MMPSLHCDQQLGTRRWSPDACRWSYDINYIFTENNEDVSGLQEKHSTTLKKVRAGSGYRVGHRPKASKNWTSCATGFPFPAETLEASAAYHPRQMAVLPPSDWKRWIYDQAPMGELLRPLPAGSLTVTTIRKGSGINTDTPASTGTLL
jgi:hypothetical protein